MKAAKRVLILTASFGDGHNAAALNLREAIELLAPEVKVDVVDAFASAYGMLNTVLRSSYQGIVRYAPLIWRGVFSMLDRPGLVRRQMKTMLKVRQGLMAILRDSNPDVVVSTYPAYSHLIEQIYTEHASRPFRLVTIVTDSISICSAWFSAPSDAYVVANEPTAKVLCGKGVTPGLIEVLGFPVSCAFAQDRMALAPTHTAIRQKVLYVINTGKAKAGKTIDRLLRLENVDLTITVGRNANLKAKLARRLDDYGDRVRILGWTNQMPFLLLSHHLVIGKAGGALVQEAIAARCPMIVNQVIPGQEQGNEELIRHFSFGAVARRDKEILHLVEKAFAHQSRRWSEWVANLEKISRPAAAIQIARFVLKQCEHPDGFRANREHFGTILGPRSPARPGGSRAARVLLCDFHIHTNYSDGRMTLPEVIDFYGRRGFDCICITDHVADPRRMKGKFTKLLNYTLATGQLEEYFQVIESERRRAWRKYEMLVMSGLEFNKEGLVRKTSGHLLGIGLAGPVDPSLDYVQMIARIHAQGGLAVASHPHVSESEWGKNTLFLWENMNMFVPIIDAWEIANRNDLFAPAGFKRLAFLANSDFHKPKHIYSWKTLLQCEKHPEAIKDCICRNENVAITIYRDNMARESLYIASNVAMKRPGSKPVIDLPLHRLGDGLPVTSETMS